MTKAYIDLLKKIKEEGVYSMDRTGVGRHRIFGVQTRFDISDGTLPVVTTRKVYTDAIIKELLWFISGSYNTQELRDQKVKIWDKWTINENDIKAFADKYAAGNEKLHQALLAYTTENYLDTIGEMYGAMWRNAPRNDVHRLWPEVPLDEIPSDKIEQYKADYKELVETSKDPVNVTLEQYCSMNYYATVDQLNELIRNLKKRPYSSRLVVSAWIPSHVPFEELSPKENVLLGRGALAACHAMFQCFAVPPNVEGGKPILSLMMLQRSCDTPVGGNYNIAQYSLLLALIAHCCDMEPGEFIWSTGDTHIYSDQMPLVDEQIARTPFPAPKLWLNPEKKDLFSFTFDDIKILDYKCHPHIPYPVAE